MRDFDKVDYLKSIQKALKFIKQDRRIPDVLECIEDIETIEDICDGETAENKLHIYDFLSRTREGHKPTYKDFRDMLPKSVGKYISLNGKLRSAFSFLESMKNAKGPPSYFPTDVHPDLWGEVARYHLSERIPRLLIRAIDMKDIGSTDWKQKQERLLLKESLEKHADYFKGRKWEAKKEGLL